MKYPIPADTPSISQGTSTIQRMPMARRTPVRIWPSTPGRITLRKVSQRVAATLWASCSQRGSSCCTPAAVFSTMGQTAAKVSRK
ncbi:hypothetical protein G6F35_018990 [Rhizopus arrhizus]|nr:hypothetical protein G6F35_018990 [Rhizopus arrhizus]